LALHTSDARQGCPGPHGARRSPWHAPEMQRPRWQSASAAHAVPGSALQAPDPEYSHVYPWQQAIPVTPEHGASWPWQHFGPLPSSIVPQCVEQHSRSEVQASDRVVQHTSDWQWAVAQSPAAAHAAPTARGSSHVPVMARHASQGPVFE
jgi:hypothetical protein